MKNKLKNYILVSVKECINEVLEPGEIEMPLLPAGKLPDPKELYDIMGGKEYDLKLNRHDKLIWDYAMTLSDNPLAGSVTPGKGFHASLSALIDVPEETDLLPSEFDKVDLILDEWYNLYSDEDIKEQAFKLVSEIIEKTGIIWVDRKYWREPIVEQISNPDRIKSYEKLMRTTGLSYREILEDLLDALDQNSYEDTFLVLRNKYGYSY